MKRTFKGGISVMVTVLLVASFLVMGCAPDSGGDGDPEQVATPTATPGAGAISAVQTITLASATEGATIYYTIDGSAPTSGSTEYSVAFTLSTLPATVKAIAVKAGMTDSAVLAAAYTLLVLPSYTLVSIPTGTVTTSIGESGGPFINASTTNVHVPAFKMGETEVTYELWYAVKEWAKATKGYSFANEGREGNDGTDGATPTTAKQEPVTYISWHDAVVWCNAYSESSDKTPVYTYSGSVIKDSTNATACDGAAMDVTNGYRLPTEAEWEYAARGGVPSTSTPWTYTYAGSNTISDVAVYSTSATAEVKSKNANSKGLYDMSGNVVEWCWDSFSAGRVIRGGVWDYIASNCEVSYRNMRNPGWRDNGIGFRVVCQ